MAQLEGLGRRVPRHPLQAVLDDNVSQLGWLSRVFRVGLILLVVGVAPWVAALAERP